MNKTPEEYNLEKAEFGRRVGNLLQVTAEEFGMVFCLTYRQSGEDVPISLLTNSNYDGTVILIKKTNEALLNKELEQYEP